jgi:PIN domain nuclease of toxin-antitoxin system
MDTHAFFWWYVDQNRLPAIAVKAVSARDNSVFVSAANALEITTKHRLGQHPIVNPFVNQLRATLQASDFERLPLEFEDRVRTGQLAFVNRDRFERLLSAKAINRDFTLISNKAIFDSTNVKQLWS